MPGGVYHVYARGVRKYPIFLSDADREDYLKILESVVKARDWRLLGYCLMGNHIHLLVETPNPDLDKGMQRLHSAYATRFNARHGYKGHLFESRYGSARARNDARIREWSIYIALNPVAANFCAEPGDWRWSSYRAAVGDAPRPSWLDVDRLLALFPSPTGDSRRRYLDAVRARQLLSELGVMPIEPPGKKVAAMLAEDRLDAPPARQSNLTPDAPAQAKRGRQPGQPRGTRPAGDGSDRPPPSHPGEKVLKLAAQSAEVSSTKPPQPENRLGHPRARDDDGDHGQDAAKPSPADRGPP